MKNALSVSAAPLVAVGCSSVSTPVPPALQPVGATPVLSVAARGVQIYGCRAGKGGAALTLVAPDARLYDQNGRLVGEHGAGPYWQPADGSLIECAVKVRADAPSATAIPWLPATATSSGPPGVLSEVTSVQRINTTGGRAPADGCTTETTGTAARVNYTADYVFFTSR